MLYKLSRGKVLYFKHVFLKKDVEEFTLQLLLKTVLLHNAFKIVSQQVKRFFFNRTIEKSCTSYGIREPVIKTQSNRQIARLQAQKLCCALCIQKTQLANYFTFCQKALDE